MYHSSSRSLVRLSLILAFGLLVSELMCITLLVSALRFVVFRRALLATTNKLEIARKFLDTYAE